MTHEGLQRKDRGEGTTMKVKLFQGKNLNQRPTEKGQQ